MCAIVELKAGVKLPDTMMSNVVWNNPHGFGIIVKKDDGLKVIKRLDENGTKPESVIKLLDQNIDHDRYLHVRWKTEGGISKKNIHPFQVYKKGGKEVWFMHNGTLSDYKPPYVSNVQRGGYVNGNWTNQKETSVPAEDEDSDSKRYAEQFLIPLLEMFVPNGQYGSEFMMKLLNKDWSALSKGILVSNFADPIYINPTKWEKLKVNEVEVACSNNDYFWLLKRGFEFDRRKEEEDKAKAESNRQSVVEVTKIDHTKFVRKFDLGIKLEDIMDDYDAFEPSALSFISNVMLDEWEKAFKLPEFIDKLPELMVLVGGALGTLRDDLTTTQKKLEGAERKIKELIKEEEEAHVG